jgi:DNA helicase-2/ATP-dependent DNA helicase PcrA
MSTIFDLEYNNLNKAQKQAVDTLDGPVMVVAGPGTGKTQVLSLRIANILTKTDTSPNGILCLTFTNSGVRAMRQRLFKIIGQDASSVSISTFHSFALNIIEKNYALLDYDYQPELLDDAGAIGIFDYLLDNNDWQHLRSRSDSTKYFHDVRSLVSMLKREKITPEDFAIKIDKEIESLELDPESISSRGESKGQIKQAIVKQIESLRRTSEVVQFYKLYESYKKDNGYIDYDDVLNMLNELVRISEDLVYELRENFLYVLVDEHQDSTGVQNEFLKLVWHDVEKPNIFVVGDDRQLIYGFGGASISYFENFKTMFGRAELITLSNNYRSTQSILDAASHIVSSAMADADLVSNSGQGEKIQIVESPYMRDEIIFAGKKMQEFVKNGGSYNECAILVSKNSGVRSAITILKDMGLPVSFSSQTNLFSIYETNIIRYLMRIAHNPYDAESLAAYLLSPYSGIDALMVHKFIKTNSKNLSVESLFSANSSSGSLFEKSNVFGVCADALNGLVEYASSHSAYEVIQYISSEFILSKAVDHDSLILRAEVIRTMLHLALSLENHKKSFTISDYLEYLSRLESYGETLPVAGFNKDEGIKVMTMHASKGLEFEFVFMAHMDEKSLNSSKVGGFTLPENVKVLVSEKDEITLRRQVYVAMTRAKKHCYISYAALSYTEATLELAHIFHSIPEDLINKISLKESEEFILKDGVSTLVTQNKNNIPKVSREDLAVLVAKEYEKTKVSVTMLKNFFECPWKWYFRNLLQLPEAKSSSLVFGSVVHECIESILKNKDTFSDSSIEEYIKNSLSKNNVVDSNEIRRISKDANELLVSWVKNRLPKISKNYETERSISFHDKDFPGLTIYGKIDLTEKVGDNEFYITDFKTGKNKTTKEIEKEGEEGRMSDYLRQLAMYTYLVQGSMKGAKVLKSSLEFLESEEGDKNAIYTTQITEEQLDLLKRDIKEYDDLLKSGEWVSRPCFYNSYGRDSVCENCKLANRIYGA